MWESMRAQTIDVKEATGRVLCCTVFRAGGKKLLAKGHVISDEDARMLETEGMSEVWVTELEEGEVGEDEAVMQVASNTPPFVVMRLKQPPGERAHLQFVLIVLDGDGRQMDRGFHWLRNFSDGRPRVGMKNHHRPQGGPFC